MNVLPIAISGGDGPPIHLLDAIAKGRIQGRAPLVKTQRLAQQIIVAASKAAKVPEALASAHDPKHYKQQEMSGQNRQPNAHKGIRDQLEVADNATI